MDIINDCNERVGTVPIDQHTKIFGLIGYPLGHSLSPLMHNRAFEAASFNGAYLAFTVAPEDVSEVVPAAKALGIHGFNVTIPHKESIMKYLDRIDPEAEMCGSVNTVIIEGDQAIGYNTDGSGFIRSLQTEGLELPATAVILGAGGSARAIGSSLAARGCDVVFVNRHSERARILASDLKKFTDQDILGMDTGQAITAKVFQRAGMVVNTTPVGMFPRIQEMPAIPLDEVQTGAIICDIIYNPLNSRLLTEAASRGFKTVNGLGMFINQGASSWQLFTGQAAPIKEMYEVVQKYLAAH